MRKCEKFQFLQLLGNPHPVHIAALSPGEKHHVQEGAQATALVDDVLCRMDHQEHKMKVFIYLIPAGVQKRVGIFPGLVKIVLVVDLVRQGLIEHVAMDLIGDHTV